MKLDVTQVRKQLQEFNFGQLFIEELGWSSPLDRQIRRAQAGDLKWQQRQIAQLAGVVVLEITHSHPDEDIPLAAERKKIHEIIQAQHFEHILIFVGSRQTQSVWSWLKREGTTDYPRDHLFVKGQTGDLLISKIAAMFFDISDFDQYGNTTVGAVARRVQAALDVEKVIKQFYREYDAQRLVFVDLIKGIDSPQHRRWYASVLLHRLMFIYFLQRKGFVDNNYNYLRAKLDLSQQHAPDRYYRDFLVPLFFEGFAKPAHYRQQTAQPPLGTIPYLNGGLFLRHQLEELYPEIDIPDQAFDGLLGLFSHYSWNLNDTSDGDDDQINPDVLGYIFEKYINDQKSAGAYYTRTEITEYLCEQTIYQVILAKLQELYPPAKPYHSLPDLLLKLDSPMCRVLLQEVLPPLSILDPACGSGAFLVAAMKTLFNIYTAVIGRIEFLHDRDLQHWLDQQRQAHPSLGYWIKRTIITNNIFGVDLMAEGMEIARLRLFLALVSSARTVDELEPLPNIDFNIFAGNSLVGLLQIDPKAIYHTLLQRPYAEIVAEKNRMIADYRKLSEYVPELEALRDDITRKRLEAAQQLNGLLETQFNSRDELNIRFEQPIWNPSKQSLDKPLKRPVSSADLTTLLPFHWGYEFDQVLERGGFDVIIANPPWDTWKPQAKEFFAEHSEVVTKNKMTIKEFETQQAALLQQPDLRQEWLDYLGRFPHISQYYRTAPQYQHQISQINGKKTGSDVNLYKVFTEQCYNLLRPGGMCGIVLPSGIYTDLGTKALRELLFSKTKIHSLFGFENRKTIFEGVDSRFKFVVLTFEKGQTTTTFPAAFMRLDVNELDLFPQHGALELSVDLIKQLSPDSLSIMEFKSALDVQIAMKMLDYPLLGEEIQGTWNLSLTREFDMTNDSNLFEPAPAKGRLPLYEGKMIHQFIHRWGEPRYWVDEKAGRAAVLGRTKDTGQVLDYQRYRLGFRAIARNTDTRTLIIGPLPQGVFCGNSILVLHKLEHISDPHIVVIQAILNSFAVDYYIRQLVSANINMFYIYQLPVPRLTERDAEFWPIVRRAARLICTTPEFDELAQAVGMSSHQEGATNEVERARLRAELDGLIAHLYHLTEAEFAHILSSFPIVPEPVRVAAQNAYRDVALGLIK